MRPLSKLEKKFITKILELDQEEDLIYIHNILSDIYDDDYEIDFQGYERNAQHEIAYIVKLRFRRGQQVRLNGIIGDLISLSYFIETLVNEGYLVKEKIDDLVGHRYINRFEERENLLEYEIASPTIKTRFAENLQYKFFATELLRELKSNKFRTFEKKEASITRKIAIAGVIISILAVLASILLPLIKQDTIKIDKETIDYVLKSKNTQKK